VALSRLELAGDTSLFLQNFFPCFECLHLPVAAGQSWYGHSVTSWYLSSGSVTVGVPNTGTGLGLSSGCPSGRPRPWRQLTTAQQPLQGAMRSLTIAIFCSRDKEEY